MLDQAELQGRLCCKGKHTCRCLVGVPGGRDEHASSVRLCLAPMRARSGGVFDGDTAPKASTAASAWLKFQRRER